MLYALESKHLKLQDRAPWNATLFWSYFANN